MGRSKNSFFGGPMNVGAFRNYPYWAAPQVWGHAVKLAGVAFVVGVIFTLWLVQKHPDMRELKSHPQPTVTVTEKVEFVPDGPR